MAVARDKYWLFGVRPHQDDVWLGSRSKPGARRKYSYSRVTPAEGAFMLDIPNVIMVVCDGEPACFSQEAYGYMESFCRMKNVQWSCSGSDGFRSGNEEEFVCRLAEEYHNVSGAYLDDFFNDPFIKSAATPIERDERAKKRLEEIAEKLSRAPRPLDLHLVYYTRDSGVDTSVFEKATALSLWTWKSEQLIELEKNFSEMEKKFPDKKKLIGIYMFDFEAGHPVSLELMEYQCEFSLQMLKEGRADGLVFEANSTMGMRMDSELWLRDWIERNKNTYVPD